MAEKLSWTELRRSLASRAGVSEKKAGAFLNALQSQLIEGLKSDKQVKINGLGTFKLQAVAPRKSVNVTTGEEMTIPGYNKLAFTPEAGVKELLESTQPSVASHPASETDPIQKLGAQAEEIVDILGELGQMPVSEAVKEEPETKPEPKPEPEIKPEAKPEPEHVFVPTPEPEPKPEPKPEKPEKKSHFWRDTLICVVILLMLLTGGYFFLRQQMSSIIRSFLQPEKTELKSEKPNKAKPAEATEANEAVLTNPEVTTKEAEEEKPVVTEEPTQTQKQEPKSSSKKNTASTGKISDEQIMAEFLMMTIEENEDYPDLITIEAMHQDSRLAWMSKRFYGTKVYWPYLYDANRDIITNPSVIIVGTPIRVPKLTKEQLDTTSAAFIRLKAEAEAAIKIED